MEEALEATTEAGVVETTLDKAVELVEGVITLPNLQIEFNLLTEQVDALYNRLALMGLVEILLVIAVIYLLWKSFKK